MRQWRWRWAAAVAVGLLAALAAVQSDHTVQSGGRRGSASASKAEAGARAVKCGNQLREAALKQVVPQRPEWAVVAEHAAAAVQEGSRRKAVTVLLGVNTPSDVDHLEHTLLAEALPEACRSACGREFNVPKYPTDAGQLVAERVGSFLQSCPSGIVILDDIAQVNISGMATLAKATAHNGYIDNDGWRTRTRSATFIFTVRLHGSNLTSLLGPERYREELTAVMRRKPWAHWVASVKDMPRPSPSMGDGMKYVQYHKLHVLPWLKNVDFMAPLDASAGYAREMDLKHRRWQGNEEAAEKELQHYLKHPELQRPKRVLQRLERKEREARRRTAAQ